MRTSLGLGLGLAALPVAAMGSNALACEFRMDTFVGGGTPEGADALTVNLYPYGVAVDGDDLLIMTDGRLRRLRPDGTIHTIAGGQITSVGGNERIRCVENDGTINTIAGNGLDDYNGDGQCALDAGFTHPDSAGSGMARRWSCVGSATRMDRCSSCSNGRPARVSR